MPVPFPWICCAFPNLKCEPKDQWASFLHFQFHQNKAIKLPYRRGSTRRSTSENRTKSGKAGGRCPDCIFLCYVRAVNSLRRAQASPVFVPWRSVERKRYAFVKVKPDIPDKLMDSRILFNRRADKDFRKTCLFQKEAWISGKQDERLGLLW